MCQWVFGWQEVKTTLLQATHLTLQASKMHLTLPSMPQCQFDMTGDLVSAYQR